MTAIKPLLSICQSAEGKVKFPPPPLISADLSGVMSQTGQSFSAFLDIHYIT